MSSDIKARTNPRDTVQERVLQADALAPPLSFVESSYGVTIIDRRGGGGERGEGGEKERKEKGGREEEEEERRGGSENTVETVTLLSLG